MGPLSAHYYGIHTFNGPVKQWPIHVRNMGRHPIYPSSDWKQETLIGSNLNFDIFLSANSVVYQIINYIQILTYF